MAKDYAKAFYNSGAWRKTQELYLSSKNYVCEDCGGVACIVHHIKYITPANISNPEITLQWENLRALCAECHAIEHKAHAARLNGIAFDTAGNVITQANVFLVCGGSESCRSAYTAAHKTRRDLVVDLDCICAALMGEAGNNDLDFAPVLSIAQEVRTLLYNIVRARRGRWHRAFVVITATSELEQSAIASELNAKIVTIPPGA